MLAPCKNSVNAAIVYSWTNADSGLTREVTQQSAPRYRNVTGGVSDVSDFRKLSKRGKADRGAAGADNGVEWD